MNRISDDVIERIIDFYLGDISEREKMDLERWVKETPGQEVETAETIRVGRDLVRGGGLTVGGYFPRVLHEPERTGAGDIA